MSTAPNNPFFPSMEMPDFSNVSQSVLQGLDMMSQAWANMGSITQTVPTMSMTPEDLDKRIAELRAVENWLRINQNMLQSTIQGLEVQRATIATLNSFANSTSTTTPKTNDQQAAVGAWWNMVTDQFNQIANATAQGMAAGTQTPAKKAAAPKKTSAKRAPAKKAAKKRP